MDRHQRRQGSKRAARFRRHVQGPGRYPALELAPQQRRQRTLDALSLQMEVLTRAGPVLMIFEDVHWIDPTSLEALGQVVDRIRTLRVLLIVTFRPEFEPPWIGRPHTTALTIGRLAQREVDAMIDQVVGNKLLPASIRQDIIERTDGIPLFVEEMTKAVLKAGSQGAVEHVVAAVPSPALAVPATLHASLMARLDRLGPAKELAQIGAAIGREFSHALLAAVMRKQAAALWGKAGLRSAQRSALVEAAEQLRRALDQIATLTPTSALRREEIKLQVALIHVSGYAAPETRAAVERARLLIEQAEALGEPPEDPVLLF